MRTGRFRFENCALPPKRWWQRRSPGTVQVLYVEVDEPIDGLGNRGVLWRLGNKSDACNIEGALNSRLRRQIRRAEQ